MGRFKHTKDRVRRVWNHDQDVYVVVDPAGQFLALDGTFGDAGDARLMMLGVAHSEARRTAGRTGNDVFDASEHPRLAVLFYTNR